jgi:beta-barrel assembly-enhancing protease
MVIRPIFLCVLATLPSLAQKPTKVEKEAALGKQLASDFREHTTSVTSPIAQQYVDNLGQKLASQTAKTTFSFTFSIIADDPCSTIHEPATFPGGYVFVPVALFMAAQDEAEFAGMLAHAMAHVVEHHGAEQARPGELVPSGGVPLGFMSGVGCSSGLVVPAGGLAPPAGFLKFQRTLENEADLLAVQTMAASGFDANALVRYTERVQPQVATTRAVCSPLPLRKDRIASMASAIARLPPRNIAVLTTIEFEAVRKDVRRLTQPIPPARPDPPSLRRNRPE